MGFFDLDKKWKVWIYRIGIAGLIAGFVLNLIMVQKIGFAGLIPSFVGVVLIGVNANLNWGEDIFKTKQNPKFNGKLEKFFYLYGMFVIGIIIIGLLNLFLG